MYKKKNRLFKGSNLRMLILICLFSLMALVLIQRLFVLQIMNGEEYLNSFALSIKKTKTLPSTRGEIYDCNGELLAYNKLSYVVTFEDNGTYETTHLRNLTLNSVLYRAIKVIEGNGDSITTDFKIAPEQSGGYRYTAAGFNLSRFKADIFGESYIDDLTDEQLNITADDLMDLLCSTKYYGIFDNQITAQEYKEYGLPEEYTQDEILQLVSLRSTLAAYSYQRYNAITIAKNVSEKTVSMLMENSYDLPGINVTEDYLRYYNNSQYFAQLIGYTGKVSSEELTTLQEENKSYSSNDIVGKVGLEKVMETSLQGTKGSETIYVDSLGRTLNVESRVEPQAGDSLYLTLDSSLQEAAYKILEEYIAGILWQNIVDTDSIDTDWYVSADDVKVPVYDVYFALFENNVLDVTHLSNHDASANEKRVYELFEQKLDKIFSELKTQLTVDNATPYKDLTDEMKVYQSYIVNDLLQYTGILNSDAIDSSDLTWIAWSKDETISLQEFLTYAISKNWIDINGIAENTTYMDSYETYTSLADFIQEKLSSDMEFCKRVFRYMLIERSLSGAQVCLLLYDQGVLAMDVAAYDSLSDGTVSAYDFIRDKIYNLEITPGQLALYPCSGAIVITDPDNGDVKACVSYPGYDNNRLVNDMDTAYYNKLVTDLSSPFYSRATQEVLAPGSTFKIVTAVAGVMENQIGIDEGIGCSGEFDQVDPPVKCWTYPGYHGIETLSTAIRDSCNFYFNTVGFRLSMNSAGVYDDDTGIAKLKKYASMFGLDSNSGVEVPETAPQFATYDSVRAAMGQSNNAYTLTELARYVNTIANSGKCYNLTLIDRVTDSNGNVIDDNDPEVNSTVELPMDLWSAIHSGMRAMCQQHSVFRNYTAVAVAGKTGTAQETSIKPNHALFMGYAPSDDPQMAIAVRVANGYSSANAASIAKDIISYYFGAENPDSLLTGHAMAAATDNAQTD